GVVATYTHDFADREVTLSVTTPGGAEPVVQAASYLPSGPLSTLMLGSGATETRAFDQRYAPTAIALTGALAKTFTYQTDRVGNILEIVEQGACTPGPVLLENQTVTTTETFTSCTTLEAGNGFTVESPGDVTFQAQGTIVLKDGFSVGPGARFTAGSGDLPPLSVRTYTYQSPQYFLTGADGPWGTLDWSYDRIGNRLSESRDQGATQDGYVYATNGSGGNTPILDQILLAVGGTRDYSFGPAGHLEEVAAGANVIDFASDAEGRLAGTSRTVADVSAAYSYDGRSFLTQSVETTGDPSTEAASIQAVYDSAGLLHALRRRPTPADPQELVVHLYLAGRPVAQVAIDGAGTETWTYFTADHLGTPLLATDDAGTVSWEGKLEPFGRDYQAGTTAGALESRIFLRLPGQWDESTWADATSGAGIYMNVHRWYQSQTGPFARPDPLSLARTLAAYLYAGQRPVLLIDPLGLQSTRAHPTGNSFHDACCGEAHRRNLFAKASRGAGQPSAGIVVCCNGAKVPCALAHDASQLPASARLAYGFSLDCVVEHEKRHIPDLPDCPPCDAGPEPVDTIAFSTPAKRRAAECPAADVEINCLEKSKPRCAGDPNCIQWLDRFKAGPRGLKRTSGCPVP
ncbi:MAG TPA: RHS repeat-associated core domain-containing protein, partial [Thermoanaerobaculia bacterium]|nr:RHS repeat-associated core domain-containing protein [Thermoanaerobaculia bacterium]